MKRASADLIALLANSNQFAIWEIYTITLADGTVLRYPGGDVGIPGVTCFDETFESLAGYANMSGNAGLFALASTPYGGGLSVASQTSATPSEIRKSIAPKGVDSVSMKFRLNSLDIDDAAAFDLRSSSGLVFSFNPRREASYDALRRGEVLVHSERAYVTAGSLSLDTWYEADVAISPVAGNTTCTITDLSTSNVVHTVALALGHAPLSVEALAFVADSGGGTTTSATTYADVHVCGVDEQ